MAYALWLIPLLGIGGVAAIVPSMMTLTAPWRRWWHIVLSVLGLVGGTVALFYAGIIMFAQLALMIFV